MSLAFARPTRHRLTLRRILAQALLLLGITGVFAAPSQADLIGTTVIGGMFTTGLPNDNCFSVTGCSGTAGTGDTATVGGGTEFTWPGFDFFTTADVGGSTLDISFSPIRCCDAPLNTLTFTFQDTAFTGAQLSLLKTSGFPPGTFFTYGLVGDTITVHTLDGLRSQSPDAYTMTFGIAAVPEPSTPLLAVAGLLWLALASVRRGRRNRD